MTLRSRLLAALALVVVTLGIAGVAVTTVQRNYLTDQLDQQLDTFARNPAGVVSRLAGPGALGGLSTVPAPGRVPGRGPRRGPGGGPGGGGSPVLADVYVGRIAADGRLVTLLAPANDPQLRPKLSGRDHFPTPTTVETSAGRAPRVRVVMVPVPDGSRAVFAVSTSRADDAAERLVVTLAIAGLVVLAVMALVVWWVIRLGLRPIQHMTEAADAIAAGARDRRVEVPADGTEAARLGQALNTMIDTSQAAETRLRQFVADASHELRTPLTTLRGYSSLHASGGLPDQVAVDDAMRRINEESTRMSRIVEELLLLADLDEHRTPAHERVDLAPILTDLAVDLRVVQPERPVEITGPDSVAVMGDRDQLTQAIAALTTNALRYTPSTSVIELRISAEVNTARIEVVDHGPGIDSEHLPHLFDRFYRADTGRARRSGGNGLGLAIVASIVTAHGGTYGVESGPGSGSTFWIELTLAPPKEPAAPAEV